MLHLKELRNKKGLSMTDVARALGVSRQAYSYYENNLRSPDPAMVKALAEFFDVSTDYILGRSEPENKRLLNDPDVMEIAALYEKLPNDKKELVLAMARAMVNE